MNRMTAICPILLVFAMVLLIACALLVPDLAAGPAEPCCFANDRYEGTCKVIPGEGETCQSILAYLNNPMSSGKTYCGGTSVRGGWVQVDCKSGKSIPRQGESKPETGSPKPAPPHETAAEKIRSAA